MENTQDWETLIAARMRPCSSMPKEADASKRTKKMSTDRYEKSEKRKESRKKWQQSEAGKKSMHDRGERYRITTADAPGDGLKKAKIITKRTAEWLKVVDEFACDIAEGYDIELWQTKDKKLFAKRTK